MEALLERVPELTITLQFVLAWCLFLGVAPRPRGFAARAAACAAAFVLLAAPAVRWGLGQAASGALAQDLAAGTLPYLWVLLLMCVAFAVAFGMSATTAVFCGTAAYVIQNLASSAWRVLADALGSVPDGLAWQAFFLLCSLAATAVVYPACYLAFVRPIRKTGLVEVDDGKALLLFFLVALVCIVLDAVGLSVGAADGMAQHAQAIRAIKSALCAFSLYLGYETLYEKRTELAAATLERVRADEARQFELSRQSMDAVNQRVHDLRHHLHDLEALGVIDGETARSISREAALYDVTVRTGNEVLDTILTQKRLLCEQQGVSLACMADGAALSFMDAQDVYSLFGNAIDNAMDAALAVPDEQRRSISLVVRRQGDLVCVEETNYYAGEVVIEGGLPRPARDRDHTHGFGTRSIQSVVTRHDGTLTFEATSGVFRLCALIPIPA